MKITEKMLEDWICENPYSLSDLQIVGRQIPLKNGILDILGFDLDIQSPVVVELKIRPIREQDIGQALRYCHDVNLELWHLWSDMKNGTTSHLALLPESYPRIINCAYTKKPKTLRKKLLGEIVEAGGVRCYPILVGTDIDDKTHASACGANARVFLWQYDNEDGLSIYPPAISEDQNEFYGSYPEWTEDLICWQVSDMMQEAEDRFTDEIYEFLNLR